MSLRDRLPQLPLVLAGPILRRTEPDSVTVWVALQQPCDVALTVHATGDNGETIGAVLLSGKRATIAIGQHLHLVAVTATAEDGWHLQSGHLYAYDLQFYPGAAHSSPLPLEHATGLTLQTALTSALFPDVSISYFAHQCPTFALPPQRLSHLQLMHGSCRKPHGDGHDTLLILDELIRHQARSPNHRLHQLFFTGDQLYGDDVADPLLGALTEVGELLLGWEESLPVRFTSDPAPLPKSVSPRDFPPGQRSQVAEELGGFTAGLPNKPHCANSHLFSFGEYCAMYLYIWSPVLWQLLPLTELAIAQPQKAAWRTELNKVQEFADSLGKVRRALANVPTYMIFDDHDISDDWNLNQAWCLRVLGKPLGRDVVQNGLLAYALFQAWGNTPEQFEAGRSGKALLHTVEQWSAAGGDRAAWAEIARYLGFPPSDPVTHLPQLRREDNSWVLDRHPDSLTWHYTVRGPCHDVIVLDTRTQRGYPVHDQPTAPPMLLSPLAFEAQIRQPMQRSQSDDANRATAAKLTVLVAPTNLVSLQLIDWMQQWSWKRHKTYAHDVGDAWNIHRAALAELLQVLFEQRDQIVVLSGDIHYGSAVRLDYWKWATEKSGVGLQTSAVLAQLTASAIKNSEFKTKLVHTKLKLLLPERDRHWIGWNHPLQDQEIRPNQFRSALLKSAPQTSPDWHYRIHWIPRPTAQSLPWNPTVAIAPAKPRNWLQRLVARFEWLWLNRWFQDGDEVVGLNNLGRVRFEEAPLSAVQELFWYAPWQPDAIVFSQFYVPLQPLPDPLVPTAKPSSTPFTRSKSVV